MYEISERGGRRTTSIVCRDQAITLIEAEMFLINDLVGGIECVNAQPRKRYVHIFDSTLSLMCVKKIK